MCTQDNYGEDDEDTRLNVYLKNSHHSQSSKHCVIGMRKRQTDQWHRVKTRAILKYVTAVVFQFSHKKMVPAKLLSIKKKESWTPPSHHTEKKIHIKKKKKE